MAFSFQVRLTNGGVGTNRIPAVDRIVKDILNPNPRHGIDPGEDLAVDAAIQNLKRWCDGFENTGDDDAAERGLIVELLKERETTRGHVNSD